MAAKTLFAVAAALCAFAAVTAGPAFRHIETIDKPHSDLVPGLKVNWWNATEVLELVGEVLETVQTKIREVSEEVENAAQSIVDGLEKAALDAADKWSRDVQDWADKAAAAGVDVRECLSQTQALADLVAATRAETEQCAHKSLAELAAAVEDVKSVRLLAEAFVAEAKDKIEECQQKGSVAAVSVCLFGALPRIQVQAGKVVAQATLFAAAATAKAVAVGPVVSICASSATARNSAKATVIVNSTVQCIKDKINA